MRGVFLHGGRPGQRRWLCRRCEREGSECEPLPRQGAPNEIDWTDAQRQKRAVAEYLAGLEAEHQSAETESGTVERKPDRKVPKVISPSDPASAWTAKANKRVQFGYGLNYLIDTEHAVIVDVEATPARTYDEVAATRTMIERTEQRFAMKPKQLAADTAYGTARFLAFGRRSRHHPAHPGMGQEHANGRHLLTRRLSLEQEPECSHLSSGQAAENQRDAA